MTPDALHYALLLAGSVAFAALVLAALVLHRRLRSRFSLILLLGMAIVSLGRALQFFSPVDDLVFEEFRGIVVSSGVLPLAWYAGSLVSAAGLLTVAVGALGLAFGAPRWNGPAGSS